ncbi:MAG: hypothetical protein AABX47_06180 [Nanoarchaeota archaeon]
MGKADLMEFAGAWADVTEEEAEEMKAAILKMRKGTQIAEKEIARMHKGYRMGERQFKSREELHKRKPSD